MDLLLLQSNENDLVSEKAAAKRLSCLHRRLRGFARVVGSCIEE